MGRGGGGGGRRGGVCLRVMFAKITSEEVQFRFHEKLEIWIEA